MTNRYFEDTKQGDAWSEPWRPDADQVAAYMSVQDPTADPDADEHHRFSGRATVPGGLAFCIATRAVGHWMGALGRMRSVDGEYRRPILPEDSLEAHTVVTGTSAAGGTVELEVFIVNGTGERALQGSAVVELPRRV